MSFNVKFKINDNSEISVSALDSMMFAELIYNFGQMVGLKEEHKASFTFNSQPLKADSQKKLSDIGIISDSVINVKTEIPLDYKPQNTGNSQASPNNSTNSSANNNNPQNMSMNQNMNYGNMNMMNQNMNYGNMNMMNQNMNYGNMNMMNQNMNYGAMNMMNPNMNYGAMNMMNPNMNYGAMNMNPNMNYGNMFMNPNMNYGNMYMNQNNFPNAGFNQNINNVGNNQNTNNTGNNQNIVQNPSNPPVPQAPPGYMNIIFNHYGKNITIQTQKDTKFKEVAKSFSNKAGLVDKIPSFIVQSQKVGMDCEVTVDQLNIKDNMTILVIFESEIEGAKNILLLK